MDIRVSGHQIDTGEALQTTGGRPAPRHRREIFLPRHFRPGDLRQGALRPQLHLRHRRPCSAGRGAEGLGRRRARADAAFEQAADRIEKQLRRYKRRLKDRHAQAAHAEAALDAGYTVFAPPPEEEEPVDHPPVVAETKVDIPVASVSDAVMLLDLRNTNALMFRNSGTGAFNMVYRRGDGTIGWVEPQRDGP